MNVADDFFVLLGEFVHGVENEDGYVAVVDGADGADDAVFLQRLVDFALSSHAGGVHQNEGLAFVVPQGVDRVAGGAHFVSHQRPFVAQEGIDEGGFAHVRPAHDGGADDVLRFFFVERREIFGDAVQEITKREAVHGGNTDGIAETQGVKFVNVHFLVLAVHFVHGEDHRLFFAAENAGDGLVISGHSGAGIDDEKNHVGFFHGQLRLLTDAGGNLVFLISKFDAAGVDQGEFSIEPFHIAINSISCDTGDIFHDGHAALGQSIDQSGFSHVRPAHDSYERFAHLSPSFLFHGNTFPFLYTKKLYDGTGRKSRIFLRVRRPLSAFGDRSKVLWFTSPPSGEMP